MATKSNIIKSIIIAATIPLCLIGLKTITDIRKSAIGIPADININAQNIAGPNPNFLWQNFSQGGEEAKDMIGPIIPQVKELQPKLIRIDHLFDFYQVYQGPDNYDFSRLDKAINSILSTKAIPLLSLSYTPANMTKDNKVASIPKDWNEWNKLIAATGKHYSVDLNINGIYYEVWNEPDLFGGWRSNRPPSYLELYNHTVKALESGIGPLKNYKVGGPATTAFYPNWIKNLLKNCTNNNLPLDFISWHQYSKSIADYNDDFDQLNQILTDYPRFYNIERFITEFGPNSEPDEIYDNQYSALHLMAVVSNLVGKIHRLFTFEIVDGPLPPRNGSTGWGLLTHPLAGATPKPRYHGITFLNQLQGDLLSTSGNGSWVTSIATKFGPQIQILITNYDPSATHSETFPLKITNLTPGKYTLSRTDFLAKTSSQLIDITGTEYSTLFFLNPNSATILTLNPF